MMHFRTSTLVLLQVRVQCPIWLFFCISLISRFPGMLLRYCLSDFETFPVAPVITGIIFGFTFHVRCISIVRSLYFKIFSASFLSAFLSPHIAVSIDTHIPFSLSHIMMSCLLLGLVLLVGVCSFHHMVNSRHDLLRLTSLHGHSSVRCIILPTYSSIC